MGLHKVYLDAKAYPNGIPRCLKVERGDRIFTLDSTLRKVGSKYDNYNAIVVEAVIEDKKWWQFWKRKTIHGYIIEFE